MEKLKGLLTERGDWRGHAGREKVEEEMGGEGRGCRALEKLRDFGTMRGKGR